MAAAEHTHSPTSEEIMEYLDGEGTRGSRASIEAHLVSCRTCQAVASEHRRLSQETSAWQVEPAPASFAAPRTVRPRVWPFAMRMPARWPSRMTVVTSAAAASIAVILLTPGLLRERRSPVVSFAQDATEADARRSAATPTAAADSYASVMRQSNRSSLGPRAEGSAASPAPALLAGAQPSVQVGGSQTPVTGPAIVRTATLRIVAKAFEGVRQSVEGVVAESGGFIDQMAITGDADSPRSLHGTLRVPADRLAALADRLRGLGQVIEDSQASQDVSEQLVDIGARLASARATERRLTELLQNRTGRLSDVLEVERELSRVRIDIERLDAETANLDRRVTYATLVLTVSEERKPGIEPGALSLVSRIRVAAADGVEAAVGSFAAALLFLLRAGPFLLLWSVLAGSVWLIVRRVRRAGSADAGTGL